MIASIITRVKSPCRSRPHERTKAGVHAKAVPPPRVEEVRIVRWMLWVQYARARLGRRIRAEMYALSASGRGMKLDTESRRD